MHNKPFVHVSNSYRKYLWSLSQTAFAPRVSWLLTLCETCSTPRSVLGESTADTPENSTFVVLLPLSEGTYLLQVMYGYDLSLGENKIRKSCCLQNFNPLKT